MTRTEKRLQEVYDSAPVLPFDRASRIVLMSDCHRGQGNASDNFLRNQNLFFGAMEYYCQRGFTYIELGDGDELWENRSIEPIIDVHNDAFGIMSRLYREGRLHMIYGNHDIVKSRKTFMKKRCHDYYCENSQSFRPLFPGIRIPQGLILEETASGQRIFLVHGHQGSLLNDRLWPLARFLVRYVWGPLEMVGFLAPTGAGRPNKKKDKIEKELARYADGRRQIMVAGHTHRPVFPKPGEGFISTTEGVHPSRITALEIEGGRLALVKWLVAAREDRSLFVDRQVLSGPEDIAAYV